MEEITNSKLIFAPMIARRLLKAGCQIIDIKADRDDTKKTIFVFKKDEQFETALSEILNDLADEKLHRRLKKKTEEKEDQV